MTITATFTTDTAVDREVAWLTSVDALPPLLAANGGPFDTVQAYIPRTPAMRERRLEIRRTNLELLRTASIRTLPRHTFQAVITWPLSSGSGTGEDDQRALDVAVNQLATRLAGTMGDKTHGGRFLSVAEPEHAGAVGIHVAFDDPARTMADRNVLGFRCAVTWSADDLEVNS